MSGPHKPRNSSDREPPPLLQPSQSEWLIERLVPGGSGFLRMTNGQGAFASGALPGERISVSEAEDHHSYLRATRWALLDPSPERVTPLCPVQAECGGCDLMTLGYGAQVQSKVGILREALTRTGRFSHLPEIHSVASEREFGYRTRIRLHIATDGRVGFFAAGSRVLIEIPGCPVADPELERALILVRSVFARFSRAASLFAELELRVAPAGPRLSLHLVPRSAKLSAASKLLAELAQSFQLSLAQELPDPRHDQIFPLPGGVDLHAPAQAFTQINWAVNRALVSAVLDGAANRSLTTFCDLYCGAGNFSLPLFARGLNGVGIEGSPASIAAAERAAALGGVRHARFIAADVRVALEQLPRSERFELVVLDPPRTGARAILPELVRRAPTHIAYCACDPVTLARDLRTLCDEGYALRELTLFDMFPQTHHFETLAWLSKLRSEP